MSELHKYTIRLNESDVEFLREAYPTIPINQVLRQIVSVHVKKMRGSVDGRDVQLKGIDV